MYCPNCGLEAASEEVRFCSRCGLPLAEVTALLARGGAPPYPHAEAPPESARAEKVDSPRKKGLKQGAKLLGFVLFTVFLLAAGNADADLAASVAVIGILASILRMIYALAFQRGAPRRAEPAAASQHLVQAPRWSPLPPAHTNPVEVPRRRFDTGEIVEPPSVTEHTTRHLEREREGA